MTFSCRSGGKFPGATEHVNVKKWKFVTADSGSFRHFSVNRNVCTNGKHDPGMKFITSEFCLPFSLTGCAHVNGKQSLFSVLKMMSFWTGSLKRSVKVRNVQCT